MTQRAYATYFTGTLTEMIVISGETESGRDLEIAVGTEMAKKLLIDGGRAYSKCHHVGHAIWHVKNGKMSDEDFDNCSSCKSGVEEYEAQQKRATMEKAECE